MTSILGLPGRGRFSVQMNGIRRRPTTVEMIVRIAPSVASTVLGSSQSPSLRRLQAWGTTVIRARCHLCCRLLQPINNPDEFLRHSAPARGDGAAPHGRLEQEVESHWHREDHNQCWLNLGTDRRQHEHSQTHVAPVPPQGLHVTQRSSTASHRAWDLRTSSSPRWAVSPRVRGRSPVRRGHCEALTRRVCSNP
jgi:hypothetical protein